MYAVEIDDDAADQIAKLSPDALNAFAVVVDLVEFHPWSGDSYNRQRPDGNMRTHLFGDEHEGLAIYLILEEQRRVIVLRVIWLD
jgi:hypothetical protein